MMDEKSKSKFFPVIFGVMGLTLLVLAWTIPTDTSDRITAAVIGSAGLFGAILRMPIRKHRTTTRPKQEVVAVKTDSKS